MTDSFGVTDLTIRVGERVALADITLEVPAGSVTAVVGGDGAGKSTLLRALVGLVAPDTGQVRAPSAERIGYMPASTGSWAQLSVLENMEFVASCYGVADPGERIHSLLGAASLDQVPDRLAGDLSGGMRKKLGFCMAVLGSPDLLVLDEPTTGVDPVSRVHVWRLVTEAAVSGTAVLMATTYIDEAERCGHILALEDGGVLLSGTSDEALAGMPGAVARVDDPQDPSLAWRHGASHREWFPAGAPAGREALDPELEDVVIVATLDRRRRGENPS